MPHGEIKNRFYLYVKIFYVKRIPFIIMGMNQPTRKDTVDEVLEDWDDQRPDLDSEPMEVVLRIQSVAKSFNDLTAEKLQEFGLQWWQYDVLSALRRQGEPYQLAASKLASAGMLSSGAMTHRIDRLEEEGLVRRLHDPTDRRRVLVELTDTGVQLVDRASSARFDAANRCLAGLDQKQRARLSGLLRLLLLSLQEDTDQSTDDGHL